MDHWPFMQNEDTHQIRIAGPFSASTVDAVRAASVAGVGIAMLTYWDVHEEIARGELVRIDLLDVAPLEVGIWAVFLSRTHLPARVLAFIDALRDRLHTHANAAP